MCKRHFLCKDCYEYEKFFYEARFDVINDKKMLNPTNSKKFNESLYYIKRATIIEAIVSIILKEINI